MCPSTWESHQPEREHYGTVESLSSSQSSSEVQPCESQCSQFSCLHHMGLVSCTLQSLIRGWRVLLADES